ncbi:protein kinase [Streptomyces sp. NPDC101118]|uniref:protein kinase n=1 Tax=Streptomyces sp. NPDC101118 TaxID=3366109 RepID=UPI003820C84A
MEEYAGRVLADRYRLPLPPSDEYELVETRAFDTHSGQEVLVRQVPLPEIVDAELLEADGRTAPPAPRRAAGGATRRPTDPAVRRAIEAAQAAARIPDHPRLDQVFDVFAEAGSLWIVSELVAARPLAALLADRPLNAYRAAEVASDVLTALRVLHAHGWTHRNITVRTVLVCEDGRVVLTGLAAGAAEEALCGYDPVPPADPGGTGLPAAVPGSTPPPAGPTTSTTAAVPAPGTPPPPSRTAPAPAPDPRPPVAPGYGTPGSADLKAAARAGAIAAYRAGAQAAATRRVPEPEPPRPQGSNLPQGYSYPYGGPDAANRRLPARPALPQGYTPAAVPPQPPAPEPSAPQRPAPEPPHLPAPHPSRQPARTQEPARQPDRPPAADPAPRPAAPSGWDDPAPAPGRGPGTPLAAERARQTRIAVVGAVTERWAPEQAHPVHENWQLAAPVGPATDLWALGALLYRAVQGHAPYPEDSGAELVELVCSEPPAFAEECGPLRPVVESLLRQDPTERPDFEELRGWLRSLVRSAPEPEAGTRAVPLPAPDATKLPIVRRRGELVRKRRPGREGSGHGRHRQPAPPKRGARGTPRGTFEGTSGNPSKAARSAHRTSTSATTAMPRTPGGTSARPARALGRTLLLVILLALAACVAYAMVFMPKAEPTAQNVPQRPGATSAGPGTPTTRAPSPARSNSRPQPQTTAPATAPAPTGAAVPAGYTLARDTEGFEVAVPQGWQRRPLNDSGQVRYSNGDFELILVPGRDAAPGAGDPLGYQRDRERELEPVRSSSWGTQTGVREITVGNRKMAEGQYTWTDGSGRSVYVRNRVYALGGRYHVLMVIGPDSGRDKVTEIYERATASYRSTR